MDSTVFGVTGRMRRVFRGLHRKDHRLKWKQHVETGHISWADLKMLGDVIRVDPHWLIQGAHFKVSTSFSQDPMELARWQQEEKEYERMMGRNTIKEEGDRISDYTRYWRVGVGSQILTIIYTLVGTALAAFYISRSLMHYSLETCLLVSLALACLCLAIDLFLFRRHFFH